VSEVTFCCLRCGSERLFSSGTQYGCPDCDELYLLLKCRDCGAVFQLGLSLRGDVEAQAEFAGVRPAPSDSPRGLSQLS
jgi:hypothetical protein